MPHIQTEHISAAIWSSCAGDTGRHRPHEAVHPPCHLLKGHLLQEALREPSQERNLIHHHFVIPLLLSWYISYARIIPIIVCAFIGHHPHGTESLPKQGVMSILMSSIALAQSRCSTDVFAVGRGCPICIIFLVLGHLPQYLAQAGLFTCDDRSLNTQAKLSRKVLACPFDRWKDECTKMLH